MQGRHSTFLVQSSHGAAGNFELVVPRLEGGGAVQLWRDNDSPTTPWVGPTLAFGSPDDTYALSLIQGNFGVTGNLELVAVEGRQLVHHWRDDDTNGRWQARTLLPGSLAVGQDVALLQSSHGARGNYEVVAPLAVAGGGGLAHWSRDNDAAGLPWSPPTTFGSGGVDAVAMLQGTFGPAGNLEVFARVSGHLVHYWRDDGATWAWHGPTPIAEIDGISGRHVVLQSSSGNYELLAPLAGGGMGHWWRDNADPQLSWHGPTQFGAGNVDAVAMIQSTFGGNLEVVASLGTHVVHYSRDGATGLWSGPFPVAAEQPANAEVVGSTSVRYAPPIVAIHAAVVRTHKLVVWANTDFDAATGTEASIDLTSGASHFPAQHHHLFCSGHAFLPDGRILTVGGHMDGLTGVHLYHPDGDFWEHVTDMDAGRWYPTCTALPNGQVLTMSGTMGSGGPVSSTAPVNNTLQLFDGTAGLQPRIPLPSPFSSHFPADFPTIDLYPFVYVLPSAELLVHSRNVTRFYDWSSNVWSPVELLAAAPHSRTYPGQGSSVLLPLLPTDTPPYRARVLAIGGGGADPQDLDVNTPAVESVEVLDLSEASPAWRYTAPMSSPRVMPDATLLPDGTVLVVGGSATGRSDMGIDPVLSVELFDPSRESWTTLTSLKTPRSYHSTAVLLPTAEVLVGGKDFLFNLPPYDYPEHRLEVFSPPYLFRGPRPVVTNAPASVAYAATFSVTFAQAESITSAVLIRPSCTTHSFNMEQRLVGLVTLGSAGSVLTLQAPPEANVAPPGFYLLFLLNAQGVPSEGRFVSLG